MPATSAKSSGFRGAAIGIAESCIRGVICARPIYVVQQLGGFKRGAAQSIAMDNSQTGLSLSVRIALSQTHTPESKRWYVMAKDEHNELPLQSVMELAYSEEEGPLIVTHRKRGFLSDLDVSNTKKTIRKPPFRPDGKVALTALGKRLREHLDARGLPTDKWPVMPVEFDSGYNPKEHGIVADEDLWIGWVKDSTEPLTKDRIAADLLYATNIGAVRGRIVLGRRGGGRRISTRLRLRTGGPHSHARIPVFKKPKDPLPSCRSDSRSMQPEDSIHGS
jgi:hypothetical protein